MKYTSIGDCVSQVYYKPIGIEDILLMTLICIGWCGLSLILLKKVSKVFKITVCGVYLLLLMSFTLKGNDMLESRKIYWPTEYHPKPIKNQTKKSNNNPISD